MTAAEFGGGAPATEDEPDAVARGWVERPGGARESALFVLAKESLGIGRIDVAEPPEWFDLRDVTGLDALGDAVAGHVEVEMSVGSGRTVHASWPEPFCDQVVDTLLSTLDGDGSPDGGALEPPPPTDAAPAPAPAEPSSPAELPSPPMFAPAPSALRAVEAEAVEAPSPSVEDDPAASFVADERPAPGPSTADAGPTAPGPFTAAAASGPVAASGPAAESPEPPSPATAPRSGLEELADPPMPSAAGEEAAAPPAGSTALVLEDVVYISGYPGQVKKRKKCTATLTREGVEVAGPGGLAFRVAWDVVRSIETQNADEARFRMNTKVHRDATALVIECQQDVTILLEARDCPTIPLRTAIAQLVGDLRVVVV